jgi:hypothetical protein
MKIGTVYHQQFQNGDRCYALPFEQFGNGRFKAWTMSIDVGMRGRKPVRQSVDPTLPFWIETPSNDIPPKLRALLV